MNSLNNSILKNWRLLLTGRPPTPTSKPHQAWHPFDNVILYLNAQQYITPLVLVGEGGTQKRLDKSNLPHSEYISAFLCG